MSIGTSPEDDRTRRLVAEVVSNTLAIAMERAGPHGNVFGHMMSVLDEEKEPARIRDMRMIIAAAKRRDPEVPPASDSELVHLIKRARAVDENAIDMHSGRRAMIRDLASHLENQMLDAAHFREQLHFSIDRASDAIIKCIDARIAKLQGRVAPDEQHPAEGDIDALKGDLLKAVTEALR